jgi:hypothetical protein
LPFGSTHLSQADFDGAPVNADSESSLWKDLPCHRDEDQVRLDVTRAFIYYPNRMHSNALSKRNIPLPLGVLPEAMV